MNTMSVCPADAASRGGGASPLTVRGAPRNAGLSGRRSRTGFSPPLILSRPRAGHPPGPRAGLAGAGWGREAACRFAAPAAGGRTEAGLRQGRSKLGFCPLPATALSIFGQHRPLALTIAPRNLAALLSARAVGPASSIRRAALRRTGRSPPPPGLCNGARKAKALQFPAGLSYFPTLASPASAPRCPDRPEDLRGALTCGGGRPGVIHPARRFAAHREVAASRPPRGQPAGRAGGLHHAG